MFYHKLVNIYVNIMGNGLHGYGGSELKSLNILK
jgi:hypothetical protein